MTKPQRIRLSRKKGFNLQAASRALNGLPAVNCARPSKWGNPFKADAKDYQMTCAAVALFAIHVREQRPAYGTIKPPNIASIKRELSGRNLACWCPRNAPCHCDVLLKLANEERKE